MPKKLERKLMREAAKHGYTGKQRAAYVYGTLNRMGMLHPLRRKGSKQP